ncbi:MAG: hypothetical protein U9R25_02295 [Chloroflexota bacterium]|nr:hypothetical protein [Chloroflexota bacterium]
MMKESFYDAEEITRNFDEFGIGEWDRLTQTPVDEVSLFIHTHYLKEFLPEDARVLEVGAGAGRFTMMLAGLGATVLVGDISPATVPGRGNYMHLYRSGELRDWLLQAGLSLLALSASNCLSLGWESLLEEIRADEEKWTELLRTELEACAEEGTLDMGTHLIAVARAA